MKEDLISIRNELLTMISAQGIRILERPVQDFAEYQHLLGIYYGLSRAADLVNNRIQDKQDPNHDHTRN